MAAGNVTTRSKWCKTCNRQVQAQRNAMTWGCGDLVLIPLTLGLWLVFRAAMMPARNPWRCSSCGRRV